MQLEKAQITELAKSFTTMIGTLTEFYNNSENRKKYKEWHIQKYGCEPKEV